MRSDHHTQWIRTALCCLIAAMLFTLTATAVSAQTPNVQTDEVKLLKDRVKQLEDIVDELKEMVEKRPAAVVPVPDPVDGQVAPAAKAAEDLSTFEVYGFAMLDAGYDFNTNNPDWYDVVRPTKLPSFDGEFDPKGKVYMGVRQSRMGFKFNTPTKWGELKTIFEFELFGTGVDAGQTTFRLRHAYGEIGPIGAGQYWTVFGDTDAYPNSFEYWGPNGLVWFRNIQIRWMPLKGKNSITIGLEKPGAGADLGNYADRIELVGVKPKLAWPDLTGNVRWDRDWGHIQLSGILRSIRWVDTNDDEFDLGGSAVGYGASFSSHFNFNENNVGRFQFTYGKGIENYMNDAPVDIGTRANPADPRRPVEGIALPVFGMSTFLDHKWNDRWATAAGFSMINIENSDGQLGNAFHRGMYGLANIVWTPITNVTFGSEFQWGRRENNFDGFTSNDYRIQFAFKYNFGKKFIF